MTQDQEQRRTEIAEIILSAMHYGLPEKECRILCRECGISYDDIEYAEAQRIANARRKREATRRLPF